MKNILNRLINHEMLSNEAAKNVLVNISNGSYNPSQISAFLTVCMMRSISMEELSGFRCGCIVIVFPFRFVRIQQQSVCVEPVVTEKTL